MTFLAALTLATPFTLAPSVEITGLRPIAFAPAPVGSNVLVTLEDGSNRIFNAKTRQTVRVLNKHPQACYGAAWSPDGAFVATGDETARIWIENAKTGQKIREYRTHTKGIEKLSFNVAGNLLISTGKDDEIKVYNLEKPQPKEVQHVLGKGANFYGAVFSPKLPYTFATGILMSGGGRTYDANTGNVANFLLGHDGQGAMDVAYSPTGNLVATAGKDTTTVLMDATSYKKIGSCKGHGDWVMTCAFSPNGNLIATGSTDGTVKVFDTKTCSKVADIPKQTYTGSPVAFTADGTSLLTVSDQGFLDVHAIAPAQAAQSVQLKPILSHPKNKITKKRKH